MRTRDCVACAAVIGGVVTTCLQLTPGYRMRFRAWRDRWTGWCHAREDDAKQDDDMDAAMRWESLSRLSFCGWCLAPWLTVPVYVLLCLTGRRRLVDAVAGGVTASCGAALVRHLADVAA